MKIEIWSDFVCPFCYIGKRRLEAALEKFPHNAANVDITYKSFELDPNAKRNPGKSIHELLAAKFGSTVEQAKQMNGNMGAQAREIGLVYNFDEMKHTNTFDAHRVAKHANSQGKGKEMTERLLKAYFTDSKHIGDHATLTELAGEIGLEKEAVSKVLEGNDFASHVRSDENLAKQIGVQGVPFFVFNEKYAVSGAQPPHVFSEVLEKVWKEENEKPALKTWNTDNSETTYCTDEGCEVKKD